MTPSLRFADRRAAGRLLAEQLLRDGPRGESTVLALPRGGVPVGYEVARALAAPLDVMLVRKLGAPGHEELALGAIASGGVRVLNEDVIRALRIRSEVIEEAAERERAELERRERLYRGGRPPAPVRGRTAILVDDGLATGATMLAALRAAKLQTPRRVLVAVPVASSTALDALREEADEVICLAAPDMFEAVSEWYEDFFQTSDDEVRALLTASS